MLNRFDPSTGKLELDASGNLLPGMILQPANYDVLSKMAALSAPSSTVPPTGASCSASTMRSTSWRRRRSSCAALRPIGVVSVAAARSVRPARFGDGPRQHALQEGALKTSLKSKVQSLKSEGMGA